MDPWHYYVSAKEAIFGIGTYTRKHRCLGRLFVDDAEGMRILCTWCHEPVSTLTSSDDGVKSGAAHRGAKRKESTEVEECEPEIVWLGPEQQQQQPGGSGGGSIQDPERNLADNDVARKTLEELEDDFEGMLQRLEEEVNQEEANEGNKVPSDEAPSASSASSSAAQRTPPASPVPSSAASSDAAQSEKTPLNATPATADPPPSAKTTSSATKSSCFEKPRFKKFTPGAVAKPEKRREPPAGSFQCWRCLMWHYSKELLLKHLCPLTPIDGNKDGEEDVGDKDSVYVCQRCGCCDARRSAFMAHAHRCDVICRSSLLKVVNLEEKAKAASVFYFHCPMCNVIFPNKDEFDDHRSRQPCRSVQCNICQQHFANTLNQSKHPCHTEILGSLEKDSALGNVATVVARIHPDLLSQMVSAAQ